MIMEMFTMSTTPAEVTFEVANELTANTILDMVSSLKDDSEKRFILASLVVGIVLAELKRNEKSNKAQHALINKELNLDLNKILNLLGLFKQGLYGNYQESEKPGILDAKEKAKWTAWKNCKGKSQEVAQKEYVNKGIEILKNALDKPIFKELCKSQGVTEKNFAEKLQAKKIQLIKDQDQRQMKFKDPVIKKLNPSTSNVAGNTEPAVAVSPTQAVPIPNGIGHSNGNGVSGHTPGVPIVFTNKSSPPSMNVPVMYDPSTGKITLT